MTRHKCRLGVDWLGRHKEQGKANNEDEGQVLRLEKNTKSKAEQVCRERRAVEDCKNRKGK